MGTATRDDVWLCLHLYEQRRETELRAARDWLFDFAPRTFRDIQNAMEGKSGADGGRYYRQATSYWEMIATLMTSGGLSPECVELFCRTTREFFFCYAKLAPFLDEIRAATRPTAFQNLERLCRSLPDHDEQLAYVAKMSVMAQARKKNAARAARKPARKRRR